MKRIEIYSMIRDGRKHTFIDLITERGSVADREVAEGYNADMVDAAARRIGEDMALAYGATLVIVGTVTAPQFNSLASR